MKLLYILYSNHEVSQKCQPILNYLPSYVYLGSFKVLLTLRLFGTIQVVSEKGGIS